MYRDRQIVVLLRDLSRKAEIIIAQIMRIQRELKMDKVSVLEQEVSDIDTVIGSVETLVTNLVAELNATNGDPNRVQAVIDRIDANKTRLAQLVAINTPSQTELPADGVTPPVPTESDPPA
jgi:hypothetical protein